MGPKDVKTIISPPSTGQIRRVGVDEWPVLDALYEEYVAGRNCVIARPEHWWTKRIFGWEREPPDATLYEDSRAVPKGYVIYSTRSGQPPDRPWPQTRMWVRELVTRDGDAYVALVNYLLAHDMHERIQMQVAPDDPLLSLLDDPHQVEIQAWSSLLLRVVDVPAALQARGCRLQTQARRFTLAVRDKVLPWNEGVWLIEAEGTTVNVEKRDGDADLMLPATVLAAVFSGHLSVREGARSGLIEVGTTDAVEAANSTFALDRPPFCLDYF